MIIPFCRSCRRLSIATLIALVVAASESPAFGAEPAASARPSRLAVVRTWGELFDQPAIKLATGGEVRLGVSALESRSDTAIAIYCLTQDAGDASGRGQGEVLGPLELSIARPGVMKTAPGKWLRAVQGFRDHPWRLYVAVVPLSKPGDYVATLRLGDRPPLAAATVRCNGKPYHAWMPWGTPSELEKRVADRPDGFSDEGGVADARTPPVVPAADGMVPVVVIAPDELKKNGPKIRGSSLPTLLPDEADMALKLRIQGKQLWIESREYLSFDSADENLLVRWWVNGKPVAPDPKATLPLIEAADALRALREGPLRVYLEMEFDPAKIGAKSGDRVALQVLYTRLGWEPINELNERRKGGAVEFRKGVIQPLTLLSNRVEWRVP